MIGLIMSLNMIIVDIKGEVQNPGVYSINQGAISHVVDLAGGLTNYADTDFINLARSVFDEMVIYVPHINNRDQIENRCDCPPVICPPRSIITTRTPEIITTTTSKPITTMPNTTFAPAIVNINTGNLEELITLRGIGEVIASRIIAFREATPFITIEDLMKVSGIGEVIFAQIKDFITV